MGMLSLTQDCRGKQALPAFLSSFHAFLLNTQLSSIYPKPGEKQGESSDERRVLAFRKLAI